MIRKLDELQSLPVAWKIVKVRNHSFLGGNILWNSIQNESRSGPRTKFLAFVGLSLDFKRSAPCKSDPPLQLWLQILMVVLEIVEMSRIHFSTLFLVDYFTAESFIQNYAICGVAWTHYNHSRQLSCGLLSFFTGTSIDFED